MKLIKGYGGYYAISKSGFVYSRYSRGPNSKKLNKWRKLNPKPNKEGYLPIRLHYNGKQKDHMIHRLVLEAFVGRCPIGMECRHLDGNPANNKLTNLKWGTSIVNKKDRKRHGNSPTGSKNGRAKLTEKDIPIIRRLLKSNKQQKEIAQMFGVNRSTIRLIKHGLIWK